MFNQNQLTMKMKVGMGYDVHRLGEAEELWLGGVCIPHTKGSIGHSDGDALIHAICDALLGAAHLRDIGYHFPDTDPQLKGVDSKVLLRRVCGLVTEKGFTISNVDSTICLQRPKLAPYIELMQQTLAAVMQLDVEDVSIKATTTEKLGFAGREEGVSASAVVLLIKG